MDNKENIKIIATWYAVEVSGSTAKCDDTDLFWKELKRVVCENRYDWLELDVDDKSSCYNLRGELDEGTIGSLTALAKLHGVVMHIDKLKKYVQTAKA